MPKIRCIYLREQFHYMDGPYSQHPLCWPGSFDRMHVGTTYSWITEDLKWEFRNIARGHPVPEFKMVPEPNGVRVVSDAKGDPRLEFFSP